MNDDEDVPSILLQLRALVLRQAVFDCERMQTEGITQTLEFVARGCLNINPDELPLSGRVNV